MRGRAAGLLFASMPLSFLLEALTALAARIGGEFAILAEGALPRGQGRPAFPGDLALTLRVHPCETAFGFGGSDCGHFILKGLGAVALIAPVVRDVMGP